MHFRNFISCALLVTLFWACNPSSEKINPLEVKNNDSTVNLLIKNKYEYNLNFGNKPGIAGVFDVPEMLSLCIMDSAHLSKMPQKVELAYHNLQEDLSFLKITSPSLAGQIVYTSDSSNFKFECFQLIDKMPSAQPQKSNVVVLEAEKMLVFNHFGFYQNIPGAYMQMLNYLSKNKLKQAGAFREYYVTDPTTESNSAKWLTVVMLPVRKN